MLLAGEAMTHGDPVGHQQEEATEKMITIKVDSREQAAALAGDVITDQASRLVLSGLGLDALPDVLLSAKHDRLSVLQLQRNTLALLPSELFLNLKGLQEMDVSKNRLSYIPETIGLLSSLRKLRLKGNQLRDLPDGICRLCALEELDLSQNPLECLPAGIGMLQRLTRLDLSNNSCLQEIPDEAGQLLALDHVNLIGTPVIRMPLAILRLKTKTELLRCKARRRKLVGRALYIRSSVKRAFVEEVLKL